MVAGILLIAVNACAATHQTLLTEDSSPSLDNSLVVMGIKWVEIYNDIETKEEKTGISYELLNDAKLLEQKQKKKGQPELGMPLYYLNYFTFRWSDEKGKTHTFVRFAKNMHQYENIALYEFSPGTYSLNTIDMVYEKYHLPIDKRYGATDWKNYPQRYKEDFGAWELSAGKIHYLGDLTFYFRTKRFDVGLIVSDYRVEEIQLEKIEITDNFEGMKSALAEQKPWFPVANLTNMATEQQWVYVKPVEAKKPKVPVEPEKPKVEEKPKQKKKNTFY